MTETHFTVPSNFDQDSEGYIVIAPLSEAGKQSMAAVQDKYIQAFGAQNLWVPAGDQLHVTFSHIISPDAEYDQDRSDLFAQLRPLAEAALTNLVPNDLAVRSEFDTVEAYPPAVILKATDDGSFQKMRQAFVDNLSLPNGTRKPPEIIHTTLLRFKNPVDFLAVQQLTKEIMADFKPFTEDTHALQLIHEKKIFVQEHEVLQQFPSNPNSL